MSPATLLLASLLFFAGADELSPEKIAEIDALFADWDREDSPGCALAVVQEGEVVYARGYGSANLEYGIPIDSSSVFRIASTSKQFTAASIVLLSQDGKLGLDDDVRKTIPELPEFGSPITIRHLLTHTSGLREYLLLMSLAGHPDEGYYSGDAALAMLARQRGTNFAPGERYQYCNSGYFLLSVVVERASGKPLREFANERIFGPLGMKSSHFHDDHREVVPNRAVGYTKNGKRFRIDQTRLDVCGDGGLFTTVEDLALWMHNFVEPRVGGDGMLRVMTTAAKLNNGEDIDYGLGIGLSEWNGERFLEHGGAFVGYRAEMAHIPNRRFGVICLSNLAQFSPSSMCTKVREICLGPETPTLVDVTDEVEREEFEPAEVSRAMLESLAGHYAERDGARRLVRVRALRRALRVDGEGVTYRFQPETESRYRNRSGSVTLSFTSDSSLEVTWEGGETARFERVEAYEPDAAALAELAGSYWSRELDVVYQLRVDEGELTVSVRDQSLGKLRPSISDHFNGPFGSTLRFERDEGRVARMHLDVDGAEGLVFARIAD